MSQQAQNACILLAAGRSARMGCDKLQLPFRGNTILGASTAAVREAPFQQKIFVGRRPQPGFETTAISGALPMHSSVRAGVERLRLGCEFFCVALADQPLLEARHYALLLREWETAKSLGKDLVQPISLAGRPGNLALIHTRYVPEILAHPDDDRGCHYLFKRHAERVHAFSSTEEAFFLDVDLPEDYQCAITNC